MKVLIIVVLDPNTGNVLDRAEFNVGLYPVHAWNPQLTMPFQIRVSIEDREDG